MLPSPSTRVLFSAGVLLSGMLVCLHAQAPSAAPVQPVSSTRPATHVAPGESDITGEYVLGAGDTLAIDVSDMPEASMRSVKIGSDGMLDLPMVGSVRAVGLTLDDLRNVLMVRAAKYVRDPAVTINVISNGSRFVSVIGEVNTPGLHPLDGPRTLVEMISESGGLKGDAGPQVILTREGRQGSFPAMEGVQPTSVGGRSRIELPLNELMSSTSPASNLQLLSGDIVSIPREQLVYVVGDVRRAGGFPMSSKKSVSVLQAISLAEGANVNASLKSARILRPVPGAGSVPTEVPINLDAILSGKAPDQALFANDVLFVPKSAAKSGTKRAAEIMLQVATGVAIYR